MNHPRTRGFAILATQCLLACAAVAEHVAYDDFPPALQSVLDAQIAILNDAGGICIAGRVTFADAQPVAGGADVQVNFVEVIDKPIRVYEDGWFIMEPVLPSFYAGTDRGLKVRAFGYDPVDAEITVLDGTVTYVALEMDPTPLDQLSAVEGTVLDENGQPFPGAAVTITFPSANRGFTPEEGYTYPRVSVTTDPDGRYGFDGLSITDHTLTAAAADYAPHAAIFTPAPGETAVENRALHPHRRITIEYLYQADGSRSFTAGDLRHGFISWLNAAGGVDFSQGRVEGHEPDDLRDLEMRQIQDQLRFRIFYNSGTNGFYDAGPVGFLSVTTAAESGYGTREQPVRIGHVYVVRTYEEDHYAKFAVRVDEAAFRTVVPPNPPPIEFAGYHLAIDFRSVDDYGRVFAKKRIDTVGFDAIPAPPFYWSLDGLESTPFVADLAFGYLEEELIDARVPEKGLGVLQSVDDGEVWTEINSTLSTRTKTLLVPNLTTFGQFAIANLGFTVRGDADYDGDIDLADFRHAQRCYSGQDRRIVEPDCTVHAFDTDGDVDHTDAATLIACLTGPDQPLPPDCQP